MTNDAPAAAKRCTVDLCDEPHMAKGLCPRHYRAVKSYGDPRGKKCATCDKYLADVRGNSHGDYCSKACRPRCAVDGCAYPVRKRGWCNAHYSQWYLAGEVRQMSYTWRGDEGGPCGWCTAAVEGRRRYCSDSCQTMAFRSSRGGGPRPRAGWQCVRCDDPIDPDEIGPTGKRRRSDVMMCHACRRAKYTRHKVSVSALAKRDGTDCRLCGEPIDMALRMPDLMSASVDHVVPFARGGTHDPSNLQLAHNICNRRKGASAPP